MNIEEVANSRLQHWNAEGLVFVDERHMGHETCVENLIDRFSVVSAPLWLTADTDPISGHRATVGKSRLLRHSEAAIDQLPGPTQLAMYGRVVDIREAAQRWAQTWERAWPAKDAHAIAALYTDGATYRSHPMRDPESGNALGYTQREFALEDSIECRFGRPIAAGDRAAVEWWASWVQDERELTLAGATVLRFDDDGRVVEHVDYWVSGDGQLEPFEGWGT